MSGHDYIAWALGAVAVVVLALTAYAIGVASQQDTTEEALELARRLGSALAEERAAVVALESEVASLTVALEEAARETTRLSDEVARLKAEAATWDDAEASWYGPGLYGNLTASGVRYTEDTWGVAHRTLPFGTRIQIAFRGRVVTVPVIDRGPYVAGRTLDLSAAVARTLGFSGVQWVKWRGV